MQRLAFLALRSTHLRCCDSPLGSWQSVVFTPVRKYGHMKLASAFMPPLLMNKRAYHQISRVWLESSKCAVTVGVAQTSKKEAKQEELDKEGQEKQKERQHCGQSMAGEKRTVKEGSLVTAEAARNIPIYRVVKHVMRHLWPPGQPKYRFLVALSVLCVVTAKLLKVAVPFWFKMIIDILSPNQAVSEAMSILSSWQLGVFGMVAAYSITRVTSSLTEELKTALFAPVGSHASTTIAMELFRKLHSLDLQFHLSRETGVLSKDLDRGSRAFWSLSFALLFLIVPTAFEVVLVCAALQASAGINFIITATLAVFSYIGWTYFVSNWRSKFRERFNKGDGRVGGLMVDLLLNYETVKYFGREDFEEKRICKEMIETNRELMRLDQSMSLLNFGQQAIFVLAASASLYFSTCGVVSGTMTVGDMVLVDALLLQLYTPLSFLGMLYREVQTSTQNMQAMIALLDIESSIVDKPDARPLQLTSGTIEFRDVCFRFNNNSDDQHVLLHLSFTIPSGSTVAFVGPSGSGKSTIFRLLYRFYDPTSGVILIDNQPLTELQLCSVRKVIGVIPQDPVLFNETIRYNIRYGRLEATDEEVKVAARVANIHDSIMRMSKQYDTHVGERGLKISGGEKQRVAIARAILDNPPILLADEATSALDSATEKRVMRQLRERDGKKRTIILIAHRLTTTKDADIIFVLNGKGGLAGQGTHEELLENCDLYNELWSRQLHDGQKEEEGEGIDLKN